MILEPDNLKFDYAQIGDTALRSDLIAARDLLTSGRVKQAEELYRQTLRLAETTYGPQHIYVVYILIAITEFYEAVGAAEEVRKIGRRVNQSGLEKKFIRGKDGPEEAQSIVTPRAPLPAEIRKAAQILGVAIDGEGLTPNAVHKAWRTQMSLRSVHPDLGGDAEAAVQVNRAKAQLDAWFEERAPKLGKKLNKSGDKKKS